MEIVNNIMQHLPSYCEKNESLTNAANRMLDSGIGFLPVVDSTKKVIGSITYVTICMALEKNNSSKTDIRVSHIMNYGSHTINMYEDEAAALQMMRHHHLSYLTVVDSENYLMGLVSFVSIARRIIQTKNDMMNLNYSFNKRSQLALH